MMICNSTYEIDDKLNVTISHDGEVSIVQKIDPRTQQPFASREDAEEWAKAMCAHCIGEPIEEQVTEFVENGVTYAGSM